MCCTFTMSDYLPKEQMVRDLVTQTAAEQQSQVTEVNNKSVVHIVEAVAQQSSQVVGQTNDSSSALA